MRGRSRASFPRRECSIRNSTEPPAAGDALGGAPGEAPISIDAGGGPPKEKWFVPFVVIPLGIAIAILGIVATANFLLGRSEPRTLDELLQEIREGGANARKQAAFHLARNLAEEVENNNKRLQQSGGGEPELAPRAVRARRDIAKIERAFELTKDDAEARHFIIAALGLVGDGDTAEFLAGHLADVAAADATGVLKVAMLHAIARIGSARGLPILDKELAAACSGAADAGIINVIASGYGNINDPAATAKLIEILNFAGGRAEPAAAPAKHPRGTTWKEVRWTAAVNLAKRKWVDGAASKLAIPVLLEAVQDVHDDALRPDSEKLFRGAGGSGGFLPAGVTAQGDAIREEAARSIIGAIRYLGAGEAAPILRKVAAADPNMRIRNEALEALAAMERETQEKTQAR